MIWKTLKCAMNNDICCWEVCIPTFSAILSSRNLKRWNFENWRLCDLEITIFNLSYGVDVRSTAADPLGPSGTPRSHGLPFCTDFLTILWRPVNRGGYQMKEILVSLHSIYKVFSIGTKRAKVFLKLPRVPQEGGRVQGVGVGMFGGIPRYCFSKMYHDISRSQRTLQDARKFQKLTFKIVISFYAHSNVFKQIQYCSTRFQM